MSIEYSNKVENMTIIKFKKLRWSPHSKYSYATGRMMTICFNSKEECDKWVKEANNSYEGCTQYISLPYILGTDLLDAEITEE
jgi:hypothetical protein